MRLDLLLPAGFVSQASGEGGRLTSCQSPSRDLPAEDVEDDVQLVTGALGRAQEPGYVPTPELIRGGSHQLRFWVIGVSELVAPLSNLLMFIENAIHRPPGTDVLLLIEQGHIDGARCLIGEPGAIFMRGSRRL